MPRGQKKGYNLPKPKGKLTRIPKHPGIYLTPSKTFTAYDCKAKVVGTFATLANAEEERKKRNDAIRGGEQVVSAKERKRDFVQFSEQKFLPFYKTQTAAATYRAAHSRFRQHIKPFFHDRNIVAVTKEVAAEFTIELATKKSKRGTPLSAQSQRECLILLRAILEHASDILPVNPAKKLLLPPKPKSKPKVPPMKTALSIVEKITVQPHKLIAQALLYSGMRLGEVLGLTWEDIDFVGGWISVNRTVDHLTGQITLPKTDDSVRVVPLMNELAPLLKAHRKQQRANKVPSKGSWVFASGTARTKHTDGAPVVGHRSFEQDYFAPAAKASGSNATPHSFRHLFATRMLQGHPVVEVSAWLGHSLVSTTLDIYAAYLPDDRPKPQRTMSAAFAVV